MAILNVQTRQLLPERLTPARWPARWLPDGRAFTYRPFNTPDVKDMASRRNTQSFVHRVGTPQSQDRPVFSAKLYPELSIQPEEYPHLEVDPDTRQLLGFLITNGRYLRAYHAAPADLDKPKIAWQPLLKLDQEVTSLVGDARHYYFTTSKNTPRQKIMRMPVAKPEVATAETLVPESPDEAINDEQLKVTKDGLYFVRTRSGVEAKLYFAASGSKTVTEIKLPQSVGALTLLNKNARSADLWVSAVGWTMDWQRYRYTAAARQFTPEPLSSEAQYPEFADLVVEELTVPSHDGVMVPLSLIYKKGTPRNGTAPTLLYGYGAYADSNTPYFFPSWLLWTQQGGILVNLHVRGGGELGEAWHKAGQKTTKPNTWKDAIACAEYLVKNNYTAPGKMVLNGRSAGGILVGLGHDRAARPVRGGHPRSRYLECRAQGKYAHRP
jgi:prolyl oligopeptidase